MVTLILIGFSRFLVFMARLFTAPLMSGKLSNSGHRRCHVRRKEPLTQCWCCYWKEVRGDNNSELALVVVVVLCKKQDTDIFYSSFSSFQMQSRYFSLSRWANKKQQQAKETSKGRSLCLSSCAEHYKMVMTINRQLLNCSPSTQWGREFLSTQLLRNCFFLFCNKRRHATGSFGEKNGLR